MADNLESVGVLAAPGQRGENHPRDHGAASLLCLHAAHSGEHAGHFRICAAYRRVNEL